MEKKFSVIILFFDCEQFILKTIENCAPFVSKIYISYSPQPWSVYNTEAPNLFTNRSNPEILKQSIYFDKLELVQGVWKSEEDQRNACRTKAIEDGMDYLIVQDADEFYLPENYQLNIDGILSNPNFAVYQCPWMIFWKDTKHIILHREHLGEKRVISTTNPLFAINLKHDNPFASRRLIKDMSNIFKLNGLCLHLSYVFSDEEMYRKIRTWGHAHQVKKFWYRMKWLGWNENTKYLNPQNPTEWIKAIKYNGPLPIQLLDFPPLNQDILNLTNWEKFKCYMFDLYNFTYLHLIKIFRSIKIIFN